MAPINLALSDEHAMLLESVTRLFQDSPAMVGRATQEEERRLWHRLVEMGIPTMRLAPENGGSGATLFDTILVAEAAGRHVASAPIVETIVAAILLLATDAREWIKKLADGAKVSIALAPPTVDGCILVPGRGLDAVIARVDHDLLLIETGEIDGAVNPIWSPAVSAWRLDEAARAGATRLATGGEATRLWETASEEWKLATAASLAGTAAAALEQAAAYSRERIAFGKPIGSFQGIAHALANVAVEAEGAKLLTWRAVDGVANKVSEAPALISMAFWWATKIAPRATEAALRTFGGYGLSLETDIQLFYRRAKALSLLAGDPEGELMQVAARLWQAGGAALPETPPVGISFAWGTEADTYAAELRHFIEETADAPLRARFHHSTKGHDKDFARKQAAAGYLHQHLGAEHGGRDLGPVAEAAANAIWEEFGWTNTANGVTEAVLQALLMSGTAEAKAEIVPRIMSGASLACLGFTEPQSGSDIFGTRFKAVRDGDAWVLNGQKMFTTGGHLADYILLLTRSDPSATRHNGLTVFVAPMNLPGVELQPIHTIQDERTNITFFQDVRVPDRYRLGEVDQGIKVMQSALTREHGGITYHYAQLAMLKHAVAWAMHSDGGRKPIDEPIVRRRLARAAVLSEVTDCLCRRAVWAASIDREAIAFGPMSKLFATESLRMSAADLSAAAAARSLMARDDHLGRVELAARRGLAMTVYGGTSEIQRSLIAEHFLGMPKSRS